MNDPTGHGTEIGCVPIVIGVGLAATIGIGIYQSLEHAAYERGEKGFGLTKEFSVGAGLGTDRQRAYMRAAVAAVEKTGGFGGLGEHTESDLRNMDEYVNMPQQDPKAAAKREAFSQLESQGVNPSATENTDLMNQVTALNLLSSGQSITYKGMLGPSTIDPPKGNLTAEDKKAIVKEMINENGKKKPEEEEK